MVIPVPHTLLHYPEDDVDLFGQWLDALPDMIAQAAIAARLVRLELGLFGDCKGLEGSDKSGQKSAIKTARNRLKNWQQRNIQ